jgi:myo-inositol-1(or 4)-monophosphatase
LTPTLQDNLSSAIRFNTPGSDILCHMETPIQFATRLAGQASQLLLEYYNRQSNQVKLKPDQSLVTEADLASDRLIARSIHEYTPDALILSEELASIFPERIADSVWVIDPLDGTTNFSLGLQYWGVSIACLIDGLPELGVISFPMLNEVYIALRRNGAFLNGKPIQVKAPDSQFPAPFFSCCSRTYQDYYVRVPYKARILGSATYSFCSVARGMSVLSFEARPKIWDLAAVWLLVQEAGGVVETFDQRPLFPPLPGLDYSLHSYPCLAAATPELKHKAHSWIQPL